jgi:hypothetical protein
MNRPIARKIELAALAWLANNADDTPLEGLSMVTSSGTTLAQEIIFDDTPASKPTTVEPQPPFLAAMATVEADPDLPHVYAFRLTLHVRVGATDEDVSRVDLDAILRDAQNIMLEPTNTNAATTDSNREAGAFLAFVTKPSTAPDTRESVFVPLAVYDLYSTGQVTDNSDDIWDGQLNFAGHAQDMDAFEYPPPP